MIIRELAPALSDLDEALGYYGNISPIFSQALMDEIKVAKRLITEYPRAWKPMPGGMRGFPLHRYPYLIVYRADESEILIVAYAHFKRRPNYWHDRQAEA
ncbi:MAG: type II toxin-antitoxin system RelE/ParE family toxin [Gallionella sp.]|nr:type II toxin-antitoxin system RelE/ParE family toxin [Gallionella sp.]